ncbi:pyrimidine-specific ribonucleoside hydrolase RihA [Drosophila sechellia]|uniref:GM17628 n=1 Tax=Drosophila sechellia TaxID=7238 RepID=B4IG52_DROSE|nr:pyrimidine-specific ribonucleoside hydrolase RihA [Drosophila sechellia]EDW48786.1 GM17628 [Drosophila sechellia]
MEKKHRLVVYDCDIGTDDAWGLAMMLRAEELTLREGRTCKVGAITTVHGNTDADNGTLNALRVLHTLNRRDVPVFRGCYESIVPRTWEYTNCFHGQDGLNDVGNYPVVDVEQELQPEHAVNAMYRLARDNPGQVDFLLCGPLTNFANCINLYGNSFLTKIGRVYIMGGNIFGKGNVTKSAEFNFMMDPEAAHITLERLLEPAIILPWEPCIDGEFDTTLDWRLNVLGAVDHPFIELLTRVERSMLEPRGFVKWISCDSLLTAAYLFPDAMIAEQRKYYATVELSGNHTRGQMVLDHLRGRKVDNIHGKKINVHIIRRLTSGATFRTIIAWTGFLPNADIAQLCD